MPTKTDRIRIMYLIDTYVSPPESAQKGGAEKQLYLLASSLEPSRFHSLVIQLNPSEAIPLTSGSSEGMTLMHFPIRRFYGLAGLRQVWRIAALARREEIDIIHTFFEKSEVVGWLVSRLAGIPVWVTSRRDLGFKRKGIYTRFFKLAGKDCRKCIPNCRAGAIQVIEQEGLAPERVQVIYNGLDIPISGNHFTGSELKSELGLRNDTLLVGMVANLNFEIKGHRYFLEAARLVIDKVPAASFILVGEGELRSYYEQMATDLGLADRVFFLGKRSDVPMILVNLQVSVLCSTSEGLSNVILESMAAGKPVVATRVGGSPEMVEHGVTGYIVPPADSPSLAKAIVSLLDDPERAAAMGAEGRDVVNKNFSVAAMVKGYANLYEDLTG